jgi:hypothetical protein
MRPRWVPNDVKVIKVVKGVEEPTKPTAPAAQRVRSQEATNAKQDILSPEEVNAAWLDAKRRHIIQSLNKLDRVHERGETFGMRVQRLSRNGQIPLDVANAIRSITGLRNRAVYEEYEPMLHDIQRVRTACAVVDTWAMGLVT